MRAETLDAMYQWIRPVLFRLDAETAHHATMVGLRGAAGCGVARWLGASTTGGTPIRVMGLDFPNRVGLAAGLDKAGDCVDGLGALGFGHIEIGTVTPRPQPGNPRPRLFRLVERDAVINRMGFNNPGLDRVLANVAGRRWRGVLGINIGKNFDTPNERAADDYVAGLRGAAGHADYVAVNISSPNTKGLRDLQQEDALRALLRALKQEQDRLAQASGRYTPLAVKIAPDLEPDHVQTLAALFLLEKIDAVIASNTTVSRQGVEDLDLARETGGLSGAPVREKSTALLRLLKRECGDALPLIGVGGIFSAADARQKLEAGATLVQLYTGLIYRGPALVAELAAL
ncbi:MAG: quinone-dependent dihydroorotate dehydrogenase [Verrucomicrobiales bacterium]